MRAARLAAALAVLSLSLSGCAFMDYMLFGPGYHDHSRGHGKHRHGKRDRHDRGDRHDRDGRGRR